MLVQSMNSQEIFLEIQREFEELFSTTAYRLVHEYDRLRRKSKIPKTAQFPECYDVRTKGKNNWLLIISKAPSESKYKSPNDGTICFLTYYYTDNGMRVFKKMYDGKANQLGGGWAIYTGHLFSRYNERLNLNIDKPLDRVKDFFIKNGHASIKRNDDYSVMAKCKEGMLLGKQVNNQMIVFNTFLGPNEIKPDQQEVALNQIKSLENDIEILLTNEEWDRTAFNMSADVLAAIK